MEYDANKTQRKMMAGQPHTPTPNRKKLWSAKLNPPNSLCVTDTHPVACGKTRACIPSHTPSSMSTHVCTPSPASPSASISKAKSISGSISISIYVCMHVRTYVCMCVCVCVFTCVYTYLPIDLSKGILFSKCKLFSTPDYASSAGSDLVFDAF